jgi:hypothetical protein
VPTPPMDDKSMKKRVHSLECELSSLSRMQILFLHDFFILGG